MFAGAGAPSYWDVTLIPLREAPGQPPDGVVLHAVEVTRLVEARRRAEEAEHRFTTLTGANVMGVTVTDDERLYEANDAFLAMIGRTREELEAGPALDRPDRRPSPAPPTGARSSQPGATGVAAPYEKVYVRPDGTRVAGAAQRVGASARRRCACWPPTTS